MVEDQLAKNIVYYRRKKGLSQEKVSEYTGVGRQAVTKWENDMRTAAYGHIGGNGRLYPGK